MENFRKNLSEKRWFRLAADKFLPEWIADVCDFILMGMTFRIWSGLRYNQSAEQYAHLAPRPIMSGWMWALAILAYVLCMVVYAVHGLDTYDSQSKTHRALFVLAALWPVYVWLWFIWP